MTHVHPYLRYFQARGHRVTWATLGKVIDPPAGITTIPIAPNWPGRESFLTKLVQLREIRVLRSVLREHKFDLVHAHFMSSAGLLATLAGARPLAVTVHGSDLTGNMQPLRNLIGRFVGSRAALVNPVSAPLETALRAASVPAAKLVRATLGVEVETIPFQPRFQPTARPRLLCTRALEDVYDPGTLVEALARLHQQGVAATLTFAADGSLATELKEHAMRAGLGESVEFLGGFSTEDLPNLLSSHDLYVSASRSDGTSLSLLEAMASGLYPVVSKIAANQSWIGDGRTGRLFEPGEPEAATTAIRQALDDPLREEALARNRERVEEEGDRRLNFERLERRFVALVES